MYLKKNLPLLSSILSFLLWTLPICAGAQDNSHDINQLSTQSEKGKYEVRAVWLTTIYGLDWPSTIARSVLDEERQKHELISMLDALKNIGVNTVYLQVRSRGRLIYPSEIEPMSSDFVPADSEYQLGYDPLDFAIQECHKRGMTLHAWLVVLPLGSDKEVKFMPKWSYARSSDEGVIHYNGYWYMDPNSYRTRVHLRAIIRELVENYSVSGVHLDYIRYPDRNKAFPDQKEFSNSNFNSIEAFRRANINKLVSAISDELSADSLLIGYKPLLSAAIVGRYCNEKQDLGKQWTAFDSVFQDPQAWAKAGNIDFVVPMMYFKGKSFPSAFQQWLSVLDLPNHDSPIVAGLAPYMVDKKEGNWHREEVLRQVVYLDSISNALSETRIEKTYKGIALFRTKHTLDADLGVGQLLQAKWRSSYPLPWKGNVSHLLSPTQELEMMPREEGLEVSWESAGAHCLYAIYATFDGSDPIGNNRPYQLTNSNSILIPWNIIGKDSLVGCRVGVYNLVTCEEVIPLESVWFYNR